MAVLQREPTNQYDRNAIRVLNLRKHQVGHIKKECAAKLAPVMDKKLANVEVLVTGQSDGYSIPVTITVFCLPSVQDTVTKMLSGWLTRRAPSRAGSSGSAARSYGGQADEEMYQKRVKRAEVTKEVEKLFNTLAQAKLAQAGQPARVVTEVRFF